MFYFMLILWLRIEWQQPANALTHTLSHTVQLIGGFYFSRQNSYYGRLHVCVGCACVFVCIFFSSSSSFQQAERVRAF